MASNQDARPFVDLQKDAEEFQAKFQDDIEKCLSFLDAKISDLICDPDSLGNSVGPQTNALNEFSKAKYEVYVNVKSFMNDMEKEWLRYIAVMKKLFLENVEIFLAGTKLEVKLPSSVYQSSLSPKKSPGYKKSTAVTSSIYPVITSVTKNIPVLSSPLRRKEVRSTESQETASVFSQMGRMVDFKTKTDEAEMGKMTNMPGRSRGQKTVNKGIIETETLELPKKVTFTEDDINDDLDICTLVARPTKSATRRKTLLPNLEEAVSYSDLIPGNPTRRARSKRKTISGVSDITSAAPSKRLKASSNRKSNAAAAAQDEDVAADDNLLEVNDSYSEWIALKSIDGKIPASPAVYEMKVWRAKKSAHIGWCESLRHKLTLHKLIQNSGHKQLDKYIERNYDDIQIRYEVVSSVNDAKVEVKNRVNSFVAHHKTTPAYN